MSAHPSESPSLAGKVLQILATLYLSARGQGLGSRGTLCNCHGGPQLCLRMPCGRAPEMEVRLGMSLRKCNDAVQHSLAASLKHPVFHPGGGLPRGFFCSVTPP